MSSPLYPKHIVDAKVEILKGKHKGKIATIYMADIYGYCRVNYISKAFIPPQLVRVQLHCKNLKLI